MSMHITVETQDKQDQYFRFGQDFTTANINFMVNRNPYANKMTEGIVRDALSKKFNITDTDGEILDWNDDLWEVLDNMWHAVILACKYERSYGKALLQFFKDDEDPLMLRAYDVTKYQPKYKENGKLKYIDSQDITVDGQYIEHKAGEGEGNDPLEWSYELIIRPGDKTGSGRSFIEKVWDQLFALSVLDEHATYFVIRVGGGLKIMYVPESVLEDETTMTKIENQMKQLNSGNGVFTIPVFEGLEPQNQPKFDLMSGQQINFLEIRDLLLGSVSVGTGFPRESLLGNEIGLRSSEINQSAYFSIIQNVQEEYRPVLRWVIDTIVETVEGFPSAPDYKIDFIKRDTQTDEDKVELLKIKSEVARSLVDTGYTLDSVTKLLDLEELEIEQIEEPDPNDLNERLNIGNQDEPPGQEEESEEPEN